jgi:hypothetical protein
VAHLLMNMSATGVARSQQDTCSHCKHLLTQL